MKLEEQVLSIEQMNHLRELGMEINDTALCWVTDILGDLVVVPYYNLGGVDKIPTLTLQEIWKILPKRLMVDKIPYSLHMSSGLVGYFSWMGDRCDMTLEKFLSHGENELELLYKMLCWVAKNGYLNKE